MTVKQFKEKNCCTFYPYIIAIASPHADDPSHIEILERGERLDQASARMLELEIVNFAIFNSRDGLKWSILVK